MMTKTFFFYFKTLWMESMRFPITYIHLCVFVPTGEKARGAAGKAGQ